MSYSYDDDGSLVIKALDAAMEAAEQAADVSAETPKHPWAQQERPNVTVRRADALLLVAESFLKRGAAELTATSRWCGETMDHGISVEGLLF